MSDTREVRYSWFGGEVDKELVREEVHCRLSACRRRSDDLPLSGVPASLPGDPGGLGVCPAHVATVTPNQRLENVSKIKAIRNEADYEQALARIDALMGAAPGTPESEELDMLVDLVELYEQKYVPMGFPSPLCGGASEE